jgi:DNA helicase-2/ATP-dependent DNA helicase PcrA
MNFDKLNNLLQSNIKKIDHASILNKKQLEAVETTEGPVLVIAGAGSGKTKMLTHRLSKLIEDGIDPANILLLTFTNKAANEMKTRAKQMLDERCDKVTACTYHSFCANILRRYAHNINLEPNFIIHDTEDTSDTIKLIITIEGHSKEKEFPKAKDLANIFSTHINKGYSFDDIVDIEYPKYEDYVKDIYHIYKEYNKYKQEHNILDYDDLLMKINELLENNEDVRKFLSDKYKYIMVDEYQDSNFLQLQMLILLRSYENKNICVVGDDMQSIYGFRGSEFKNIINFPKQFEGTKLIILDTNYRSNQEILDLSNQITANATEKYEKNLVGLRHKGEKPKLVAIDSSSNGAKYVLAKIIEYMENGTSLNDIAVLTRGSNDSYELEALIAQINKNYDIQYQKFGGIKFLEKSHIKDIMAYLKILVNIKDEISWFRIFQLYPNIGPVYARKLTLGIIENGIEELNKDKHKNKKYGQYLSKIYETYTALLDLEFQEQLDKIINKYYKEVRNLSIEVSSSTESAKKAESKEVKSDIDEAQLLIELAEGYKTANSFLTDMTLEAKQKDIPDEILTISTIHSAKGLEYKVVFILNCVDGTFPWVKKPTSSHPEALKRVESDIEEERRVFYVALTRAKDDLYLICPKMGIKYGTYQKYEISRFLSEDNIYKNYTDIIE